MRNYLADTTVLVDHLRGKREVAEFLEETSPFISIVTVAELIQGSLNRKDQALAVKLCTTLPQITIDKTVSDLSIELMKQFYLSHGLRFLDAIIAATAIRNKLILITGNLKHFNFIEKLNTVSQKEAENFSGNLTRK